MARMEWSDFEDAACLYLYLKYGRRQLDDTDKEVIKLARAIGRTPAAVSYKLGNFRYVDPSSHGKGFEHVSTTDRKIWNAYKDDLENLESIYEMVVLGKKSAAEKVLDEERRIDEGDFYIPDSAGVASRRAGQEKIRINALSLYNYKCAICGMDHPKLLVASHIVPWAADKDIRGDPQNVMLLCPLHDRMFDAGLISLNDDFTVIVSKALDGYETAKRAAMSISGMKLSIPADFAPKLEYLQYHRQHVFKND